MVDAEPTITPTNAAAPVQKVTRVSASRVDTPWTWAVDMGREHGLELWIFGCIG